MKAKPFDYFDMKTMEVKYGIKAHAFGKWMPVARNGKALMFDTAEERDEELANRKMFRMKSTD